MRYIEHDFHFDTQNIQFTCSIMYVCMHACTMKQGLKKPRQVSSSLGKGDLELVLCYLYFLSAKIIYKEVCPSLSGLWSPVQVSIQPPKHSSVLSQPLWFCRLQIDMHMKFTILNYLKCTVHFQPSSSFVFKSSKPVPIK